MELKLAKIRTLEQEIEVLAQKRVQLIRQTGEYAMALMQVPGRAPGSQNDEEKKKVDDYAEALRPKIKSLSDSIEPLQLARKKALLELFPDKVLGDFCDFCPKSL